MVLPHDLCAHLQNAFRARHTRIAVHHSIQNLGILSILFRAGFLSSITRGTIDAPSPMDFFTVGEPERRIWAELKYRDDRPVLQHMELISKPSKRVIMDIKGIRLLCSGRGSNQVKPLGFGEVAVIHTKSKEHEWLEAREALQLRLAGEVVCRAR
jgi:ribosomal protein S8